MRADSEAGVRLLADYAAEMARRTPTYDADRGSSADPDELSSPGGCFLVALSDGDPIGCVGLKRLDGSTAEVKRMYVAPRARGYGVARTLLTAVESEARTMRYARVRLDTGPDQPEALALYRAAGYREIVDYNANPNAAYWLEKDLDGHDG